MITVLMVISLFLVVQFIYSQTRGGRLRKWIKIEWEAPLYVIGCILVTILTWISEGTVLAAAAILLAISLLMYAIMSLSVKYRLPLPGEFVQLMIMVVFIWAGKAGAALLAMAAVINLF